MSTPDPIRPENVSVLRAPRVIAERDGADRLPIPLTTLVGREEEVAAVCTLLRQDVRLVVLTGPGGVGKTRVAVEVATILRPEFADGVCFVSLAAIADPALVISTVAHALGLRDGGARELRARLAAHLGGVHLLLVLDNFEQVADAVPLVVELLESCPHLRVLVTSRVALRVQGGRELPVPPLALPDPARPATAEDVARSPAAILFVRRASEVRPDFAVTDATARAVAEICVRLDGLPLAIELAAAWSRLLSPHALRTQLERRLPLLTGGGPDRPRRQQALRRTIAWSYGLLDADEQALFRRLAVFAGGATLDAVDAVAQGLEAGGLERADAESISPQPPCGAFAPRPSSVLDLVASLVDHNLMRRVDGPDGEPRFGMLETIREFGLEQLAASGEEEPDARERHAAFVLALAERAMPEVRDPEEGRWIRRLEAEHDNLRAALAWFDQTGNGAALLRLASALAAFWAYGGHASEGRRWLEHALAGSGANPAPAGARAAAYHWLGSIAAEQGDFDVAEASMEEALALWRGLGDRWGEARTLFVFGGLAEYRGDDARAIARYEESLERYRELGATTWCGRLLENLGDAAYRRGDVGQAAVFAEEALRLSRAEGTSISAAAALVGVAQAACAGGDLDRALVSLRESLELAAELGYHKGISDALVGFAAVATTTGRTTDAARLLGAATAMRDAVGGMRFLHEAQYRRTLEGATNGLTPEAFAAAWEAGRSLSAEAAIAEANAISPAAAGTARSTDAQSAAGLTARELEVLRLLAEGRTDKEIGTLLFISHRTAMGHVSNILAKLGAPTRAAAASFATRHGLV
jgi:non-specific serine/threonine protein kinase